MRLAPIAVSFLLLAGCGGEPEPDANAAASAQDRDGPAAPPAGRSETNGAAAPGDSAAPPPSENAAAPADPAPPASDAGACMMQDGERLRVAPLRAVGTEPFWAASIEGRCVTYSHPEDQAGTRVWTTYTPGPGGGGGTWEGALGGRRFVLAVRPQAGCSDGMSDRRYPYAVALTVAGEERSGCAAPPGAF
ncbi:MAG: hypothetical protein ACK40O_02655 [Allosphingosinicella sp.]